MLSTQASKTNQNGLSDSEADEQSDRKIGKQTVDSSAESPIQKLQKTHSWLLRDKLSREFKNIKDQDELGKLMGDAGEKLLALVDDIRKIESLRTIELDIPQVF
jgi:hypothetical protein